MAPTFIGIIVALIGVILLWLPPAAMLVFALFCSLLGAASALNVTALGNSSVPPAQLALGFLVLRLIFSSQGTQSNLLIALKRCAFLVAYCVYGAVTAFILPKIFDNDMAVVPMRPPSSGLYDVYPLHFSPQNITSAFYLMGTAVAAITSAIVARRSSAQELFVKSAVWLVWAHIGLGLLDLLFSAVGHSEWLNVVRNGNYAQLSQNIGQIRRIGGAFSETSGYSAYGFVWLVFMTELWLRNVYSFRTGVSALGLVTILLMTTSSSAYVALFLYFVVLALRLTLTPMNVPFSKAVNLFAIGFLAFTGCLLTAIVNPEAWDFATSLLQSTTVGKMQSSSGIQRSLWARQGIEAFKISGGFGVGAGSFRSSSLVSSMLGSVGVMGAVLFLAHLRSVFSPFALSTHNVRQSSHLAIGTAASWTAILGLVPSAFGSPGPDPGLVYGLISGFALAVLCEANQKS